MNNYKKIINNCQVNVCTFGITFANVMELIIVCVEHMFESQCVPGIIRHVGEETQKQQHKA